MANKILFLNNGNLGGAQMMTIQYSKILYDAGFECEILTHIFPGKTDQTANLIPNGIKKEWVMCRMRIFFLFIYLEIWKFQPNIIFTWDINELKYFLAPLRRFHLCPCFKIVSRCTNTPSMIDNERRQEMQSYSLSDVVISQTKEMEDELFNLVGINPQKIITIYNPISKERIKAGLSEKFDFDKSYINYVAIARINPQKDYPTMIEAFALLLKKQSNSRLYICGDKNNTELSNIMEDMVCQLDISDNLFFEGFQPNPYKYLAHADAFVLSSIFEGLPNAMLDAMYLGIPVATTESIPYVTQVIKEGHNGYTCKVGDSEGLAEAMLKAAKIKDLPKFVDANSTENQIVKLFKNL